MKSDRFNKKRGESRTNHPLECIFSSVNYLGSPFPSPKTELSGSYAWVVPSL